MRSDSNMLTRYLKPHIVADLERKMVFVGVHDRSVKQQWRWTFSMSLIEDTPHI